LTNHVLQRHDFFTPYRLNYGKSTVFTFIFITHLHLFTNATGDIDIEILSIHRPSVCHTIVLCQNW